MTLIIDASVAIKWVLDEEGSAAAHALLAGSRAELLAAPELLWIECANVLRTKTKTGRLTPGQARAGQAMIEAVSIASLPSRPLAPQALSIAFEIDQTAYDCLYIAAALSEKATLVTADEKLFAAASKHGVYAAAVRLLGDAAKARA